MSLPLIIHPEVTYFLKNDQDHNFVDRVWVCINKLKKRQFDGGLRVKKLKGGKKIWEARINKASRLLFSYEKSRLSNTGEKAIFLAIQDICIDHDDVSRTARNSKNDWIFSEEIVEIIGDINKEKYELSNDDLELELLELEEHLSISDELKDELLNNIAWQVVPESEEAWKKVIIDQTIDFSLKLTPEEGELIKLDNLLLKGSAGTGKTTVGLYRLKQFVEQLLLEQKLGNSLYVAYNPILVQNAKEQFQKLLDIQDKSWQNLEKIFQFKTIRDLCLEGLAKYQHQKYFEENQEINYLHFEQKYSRRSENKKYPSILVWDEIRSIIKGSHEVLEIGKEILSQEQYEELGKKRSNAITKEQRPHIYKLAEWYQNWLNEESLFDEIDLARGLLKLIKNHRMFSYQLIICDEVQDLTELQLELLINLVSPNGNLYFAGDVHQMISPSGFRWQDLKTIFSNYKFKYTEESLHFNFRNVASLVKLSNSLLVLRYRLLKENFNQDQRQETISYEGEKARLINDSIDNLKLKIGDIKATEAILVKTKEHKQKLKQEFKSTLIYTIEEAKGLEFDTVFLVDFFSEKEVTSLYEKILVQKRELKDVEKPQLELCFNLLYVAMTRAKRILNIWETEISCFWDEIEFKDLIQVTDWEKIKETRGENSPELWKKRGLDALITKDYERAIECFKNSGDLKLEKEASAKLKRQEGNYLESAKLFKEIQFWEDAAKLFEHKLKQYDQAAECWEKANNLVKSAQCWEKIPHWENSALCYELIEDFDQAVVCWEKNNSWEKAGEIWFEKIKNYDKAKICYEKAGNFQKVAEINAILFEKNQQYLKAGEEYEKAEMFLKSAECFAKVAQLAEGQENWFEAVKYWEKSLAQYQLSNNLQELNKCEQKFKQCCQKLNQYDVVKLAKNTPIKLKEKQEHITKVIPPGPQRIRGIAGSGKTLLLCQRAANIHIQHPDWNIAIIFFTRSLYQQIQERVDTYLGEFSNNEINLEKAKDKLKIFHAWGANDQPGFYTFFRDQLNLGKDIDKETYEALKQDQLSIRHLSKLMMRVLQHQPSLKPCFDAILIDEGQDLMVEDNFKYQDYQTIYWLAWQSLKLIDKDQPHLRRLYWAYDEFQSLDQNSMIAPEFKEIFGDKLADKLVGKSSGPTYKGNINKNEVIPECYRTPNNILVTALTLGLGLLREQGIFESLKTDKLRQDKLNLLGFEIDGDFRKSNSQIKISRKPEYSINIIDTYWQGNLIEFQKFKDMEEQISNLISSLKIAINLRFNLSQELLIIVLGSDQNLTLVNNIINRIGNSLKQEKINFFIPGNKDINQTGTQGDRSIFWKENAITITHTYRAKGNEAYLVFLVGLENIAQDESNIALRNQLFTAMTRTKGWLWIGGIKPENGQEYSLYQELETAIKSNGEITFINRTDSNT